MHKRLLLLIPILFFSFLSAQNFDHPLTLSELVCIAMENHPETKQTWWNAQRAAAALGSAESAYYPNVDFNANITHGRDFKFINGPETNYTNLNADLILSMMLYDYGERAANVNSAKMALIAANWNADWALQKVMIGVLQNAYALLYAQEALQAALITQTEAENMLESANGLNRAGLTSISDIYTTRATLAQAKMDVADQCALLDIQRGRLASSMGLKADTCIQIAPVDTWPMFQKEQTCRLIWIAKQRRADLMAKQARTVESFSRLEATRSLYGPKLGVVARGGYDHYIHDKANGMHYQVALNLDMPLFNGFKTVYENRAASADTQISLEELAQLELEIALEVLTYSRTLEAMQEMLCYAEENLNNAKMAYEGVMEKYGAGKERLSELSISQNQLAAARLRYNDVKTRWLTAAANLAYATGTLMESSCEQ